MFGFVLGHESGAHSANAYCFHGAVMPKLTQGNLNKVELNGSPFPEQRQGAAVTNFEARLPSPHSALAQETLKDPSVRLSRARQRCPRTRN